MAITVDEVIARFKRPITVDQNGCWNWLGSINTQGYGAFNHKLVFGIVYRLAGGSCPSDKVLCHKCNNKRCINPDHLYVGTYSENLIDAINNGKGFSIEVYRQMYDLRKQGMRLSDIARKLNVSRSLVSNFFLGKVLTKKPEHFE